MGKIRKGLALQGEALEDWGESFLSKPLDRTALILLALGGESRAHIERFAEALSAALAGNAGDATRSRTLHDWRRRTVAIRKGAKSHVIDLVVLQWYNGTGRRQLHGAGSRHLAWLLFVVAVTAAAWLVFRILRR